jgi:hypothetical protein
MSCSFIRRIKTVAAIVTLATSSFCWDAYSQGKQTQHIIKVPQFSQYPVKAIYRGKPAAPKLKSHTGARRFHTVLNLGARRGPNFAGHYTVVTWGCGTNCEMIGVIDARNGQVYMPDFSLQVGAGYQLNSKLLVVDPPMLWRSKFGVDGADYPKYARSKYYLWTGRKFIKVATIEPWRLKL